MIKIKKGLDLPISGQPEQAIHEGHKTSKVALIGPDYIGMRPTMHVQVGDRVKKGQLLFKCKKQQIPYSSPAGGKVIEINRGAKRVFESLVIEADRDEEELTFSRFSENELATLGANKVKDQLLNSGLWTALRARPYGKCAVPDDKVDFLYVTAMDSNPLAPSVALIIDQNKEAFVQGLQVLTNLAEKNVYVCHRHGDKIPRPDSCDKISYHAFSGPHPSGLAGTHIHCLTPVGKNRQVWHIGFQDVTAIGYLFTSGKIYSQRIVSLGGPQVNRPRLLRTRQGACLSSLTEGELKSDGVRVISGSVFHGREASPTFDYLGRYHNQVSVLAEDHSREYLGWVSPGFNKFSLKNVFLSYFDKKKQYNFTTTTNGSPRAIVPIGMYEKVLPLDTHPTFLLRALLAKDTDLAQNLGALELDEEDLGPCTFVCPSKTEFGPLLRESLTRIEQDG